MAIEFKNGASVHEIWGDLPDGACIATCQHFEDALALAEYRALNRAPGSVIFFVVNHLDGTSRVIRNTTKDTQ